MTYPPQPRLDSDLHRRLCEVLLQIRGYIPDRRFGQLIDNLSFFAESSTWDIEDPELLAAAEQFLAQLRDRMTDAGSAPNPDAA